MQTISLLDTLRSNTLSLFMQQNRMATGLRLNAPSEDPVLASRAVELSEVLERQDQLLNNIRQADKFLTTTDYSIGEINDLLIQAHDIASEMVNSTADQGQRESMAHLVSGIIDQLVNVGNRMYEGGYLFGGQETRTPPFVKEAGGVKYVGDDGDLTAHISDSENSPINITGAKLFSMLTGVVEGSADLNPAITAETRLRDLAGIDDVGISKGLIRIGLTSPATNFIVDLSKADTVGDVMDMIEGAAEDAGLTVGPGNQFDVTLNAAGTGLQLDVAAGDVSVTEVGEGVIARDLGILGSAAGSIVGADLNTRVARMTAINSLFGGAGAVLGSIRITNGANTQTIDLSGAQTIQDILNRINTAGLHVKAEINDDATGLKVTNLLSGTAMSIGEAGGDTATLLGIRSNHVGTDLSTLNGGKGVEFSPGVDDMRIVARDGNSFTVNLDGSVTMQDVLDKINAAAGAAGVAVTADLTDTGNGIRLTDATGGGGTMSVERMNYSYAIDDLGLNVSVVNPGDTVLVGEDTKGVRADSVFTALYDLYNALMGGGEDVEQKITAAGEKINEFIDRTNQWQGEIGARSRTMTQRMEFTEDAVITTQTLLSEVKDLDYMEAVTKFQQAQTSLQANLMTGQRMVSLSLLNFIG